MKLLAPLLVALSMIALPALSHAQPSPDPRDYEVGSFVPNGTMLANVYLRDVSAVKGTDYSAQALAFRATYVWKVGNFVITPLDVVLPVENLTGYSSLSALSPAFAMIPSDLKLAAHTTGIGDITYLPTIGSGVVENADDNTHTWYAATAYITAPTGSYSADHLINVGANRWTIEPLVTVGQRFLRAFTVEANANLSLYTANNQFRVPVAALAGRDLKLKQDPTFGAAVHLGIDLHPSFFLGLSYLFTSNGQSSFGLPTGMDQVDVNKYSVHTFRLNFVVRVSPTTSIYAQWSEDLKATANGTQGRYFGLRIAHAFFNTPAGAPHEPPKAASL